MSGYDGAEFLARVREHWIRGAGWTRPTGCWVCDVLLPALYPVEFAVSRTSGQNVLQGARRRCGENSPLTPDAHHILPRQVIKREATRAPTPPVPDLRVRALPSEPGEERCAWTPLDEILMDPRNAILVRRYHHDALESRKLAIPVALIPQPAMEFADEMGLRWYFENQEARRA